LACTIHKQNGGVLQGFYKIGGDISLIHMSTLPQQWHKTNHHVVDFPPLNGDFSKILAIL